MKGLHAIPPLSVRQQSVSLCPLQNHGHTSKLQSGHPSVQITSFPMSCLLTTATIPNTIQAGQPCTWYTCPVALIATGCKGKPTNWKAVLFKDPVRSGGCAKRHDNHRTCTQDIHAPGPWAPQRSRRCPVSWHHHPHLGPPGPLRSAGCCAACLLGGCAPTPVC